MTDDWTVRERPDKPGHLGVHPDFRRDRYPLRDDPRYLDQEPACVNRAIETAAHSELTLFVESPIKLPDHSAITYLGPDPDEIVHSWTRTFLMNVKRRTRRTTIELRKQRDDDQTGLETWAGGQA